MSKYFWGQLCIECLLTVEFLFVSSLSGPVKSVKKKNRHSHKTIVVFSVLVCFTRWQKHFKILIQLVCALKWRIFIVLLSVLFTVQSVTWDCFTLCCVKYLSFVSVLVPCAGWRHVKLASSTRPLCCEQGLTGKWNLCYIETAILILIYGAM